MYEGGERGERRGAGGRRGKEGGEGMRQSEGMLEVIEQVGVANGDHQGKSFSLRSLITSTFILHGSGDCCVGCMEHSPYTTTTFGNYLHTCTLARMLTLLCTHTHTHTHRCP